MVDHNSDDLWKKLGDLEKDIIEIKTNQAWMRKTAVNTKSDDAITTKDLKDSIDQLHALFTTEISNLSDRLTVVERTAWYQKGFYSAIGAATSLIIILIPNIGKLL